MTINNQDINQLDSVFTLPLLAWFDKHGRKHLPWQHPRTAYRVWIAEIMLQQTQVQTVIPYFERFITSFPEINQLSNASEDAVLAHWSGLGYYSRARNIYKTAQIIQSDYQGQFPNKLAQLVRLPGIGASTAAAIASLAFKEPTPILDGNVIRVLSRYFMINGWHGKSHVKKRLWELAEQCMAKQRCADYTQAIMDLGATCCTRTNPNCSKCPLQTTCLANLTNTIALYPFKKVKEIRPIKHQQFLLLHTKENAVYLEKRPPIGLWGGLWCMPTIDLDCCATEFVSHNYGFTCVAIKKLIEIKHSFSHFHLHITALVLQIQQQSCSYVAEHTGQWFNSSDFNSLGLAKPVSQILNCFFNNEK